MSKHFFRHIIHYIFSLMLSLIIDSCRIFNAIFCTHVDNEVGYSISRFPGDSLNYEVLHFKRQVVSFLFIHLFFHDKNCETKNSKFRGADRESKLELCKKLF